MRRREFSAGLVGAAAWLVAARAQQAGMPVIGFLSPQSADDDYKNVTVAFLQGLKESGYIEGQNVAVEFRWADNQFDRLPALVADLVRRRVAVIAVIGATAARAAKAATTTIPIVFGTGVDPVELGLVASLDRPGANVTGIANLAAEMAPKKLQLLRDLIPKSTVFGVLADPTVPSTPSTIADLQAAARASGLQLFVVNARANSNLESAFATLSQQRVAAVLVTSRPFATGARNNSQRWQPAMHCPRCSHVYALAGGLMSYGSSFGHWYRRVGIYTGRILNGYNPADLPVVQQVTKIELAINLKTAKSLGLTIPETLLAIADEVIQ